MIKNQIFIYFISNANW